MLYYVEMALLVNDLFWGIPQDEVTARPTTSSFTPRELTFVRKTIADLEPSLTSFAATRALVKKPTQFEDAKSLCFLERDSHALSNSVVSQVKVTFLATHTLFDACLKRIHSLVRGFVVSMDHLNLILIEI